MAVEYKTRKEIYFASAFWLAMWIQCLPLMGKTLLPHATSISPLSHLLLITWFQLYWKSVTINWRLSIWWASQEHQVLGDLFFVLKQLGNQTYFRVNYLFLCLCFKTSYVSLTSRIRALWRKVVHWIINARGMGPVNIWSSLPGLTKQHLPAQAHPPTWADGIRQQSREGLLAT